MTTKALSGCLNRLLSSQRHFSILISKSSEFRNSSIKECRQYVNPAGKESPYSLSTPEMKVMIKRQDYLKAEIDKLTNKQLDFLTDEIYRTIDVLKTIEYGIKESQSAKKNKLYQTAEILQTHREKRIKEEYERQKQGYQQRFNLDIEWRSRYSDIDMRTIKNLIDVQGCYMLLASDWFMFNKFELRLNDIDRVLRHCIFHRFHKGYDDCSVDGWNIKYGSFNQRYSVEIKYKHSSHKFVQNDQDLDCVAKAILNIMYNSPPEYINHHNLYMLNQWMQERTIQDDHFFRHHLET